ncbi:MAG: D-glucuronyl C5-epimerase family protein, partial [Melioribacteraceae bacterium]
MKKILLTIDTEFFLSKDEILGINSSNGIEDILSILKEYEVKATFFIDYYESKKWEIEIFEKITNLISIDGHQIELHLHPDILGGKPYIWQYSKEKQSELLNASIEIYKKINGRSPKYFRAGSYSANKETLELLDENNFIGDLSFQYKQKRCKITEDIFLNINKIGEIKNLIEIPTTVYKYNFPNERYNSINMEWCSLKELKEITKQIQNSNLDYFVLMMHSFSFLKRWDRKKLSKNNYQKNKFRKYLEFANEKGFEFVTVSEFHSDVTKKNINTEFDFVPQIKKPFVIISGVMEKIRNRFILNKKFRWQFLTSLAMFLLAMLLLLYLCFFNYFSPGYIEVENVNVDITSWNKDNNISNIENYFIELGNYKSDIKYLKDKNGILFRKPYADTKKYIMKPGVDSLYIATDMSGYIIKDYTKFIETNDSLYFNEIILFSNWLQNNAIIKNDFVMWPYHFKFTKYDLDYDWCGSWALGNILSAISRRIELTNDSKFIELANQTVKSFETKVEDGGILFVDENKKYWFEEYPTIPPNHVLNGHINGVMGLYDYWRITKNEKAKKLFDKGIETIIGNLHKFDSGYWSYYDDEYPYVADYYYHKAVH